MNPLVAIALVVVVIVCWFGHATREGNEALILKCGGTLERDQVLTPTWDGGRLVAVRCANGRSFHR